MLDVRNRVWLQRALLAAVAAAACLVFGSTASAATLPTLSIAVSPAGATVSGSVTSGAVNVVTTDTGVKEASVILVQLKPGVSVADGEAFAKNKKESADPNSINKIGAYVFDVEANPGAPTEAQTVLAPGQYVLLVSAGEGEPSIRANFTVAASNTPVALPARQAKIRSIDFNFRGPTVLHDGELVGFEDEGFLVHMDIALPVKNMKSAKLLIKDLKTGKEKAVFKLITGQSITFQGPVSPSAYQQETINAKPGVYVELCFMTTEDGRPHTLLGMERIIKILK